MAGDDRWYFSKEELLNTPSRKCGIDSEREAIYRQKEATYIQDMGIKLQFAQLTINTAIVYMHRFYMFHSFTRFPRNSISPAALFLAAKVEEEPRKLDYIIRAANACISPSVPQLDTQQSETYLEKAQELVMNENILLQTLGFDVSIDHPHTHVVKFFQFVRSSDTYMPRAAYIMATNSLHMTTLCLQYKPAVVACACINMICKWSDNEISSQVEGRDWFCHIDHSLNHDSLETVTLEFVAICGKYRRKFEKLMSEHPGGLYSMFDSNQRHAGVPIKGSGKFAQPSSSTKTVISHKEYEKRREKDRERAEHRERHYSHHIPPPPVSSSSHPPPSNNSNTSTNSHPVNSRLQPFDVQRRPHGSSNRAGPNINFREPPRRDNIPVVSRDELPERTSRPMHPKFIHDKVKASVSVDHRHPHSELIHPKNSSDLVTKDKKLVPKIELPKIETSKPQETRDIKNEYKEMRDVKTKPINPKVELPQKPKTEKLKPSGGSFIFNNNNFSLNDLLNPSDLPPDDIFDTEIDSKPNLTDSSHLDATPTVNQKLKTPPKPSLNIKIDAPPEDSMINVKKPLMPPNSVPEKSHTDPHHTPHESKPNKYQVPPINHSKVEVTTTGDVHTTVNQNKHSLVKHHERENKSAYPVSASSAIKSKHENTSISLNAIQNDHKKHTKENVPHKSVVELTQSANSVVKLRSLPLEKSSAVDNSHHHHHHHHTPAVKSMSVTDLKPKVIQVNVPNPDNEVTIPPPSEMVTTEQPVVVPALTEEKVKKSKSEHKKHKKHKEKDKERPKERKEHKKAKKHKKHKDREREKDKDVLKIKLLREKGVYTPEASPLVARTGTTTTPVVPAPSSSTSLEKSGGIKLTIPKSRLQNTPVVEPNSGRFLSPDTSTPKVKLKIPREQLRLDKESRKRDRESISGDNSHPAKIPRTSHGMQQVLDSSRWSSH